jgi:hypothetical protein
MIVYILRRTLDNSRVIIDPLDVQINQDSTCKCLGMIFDESGFNQHRSFALEKLEVKTGNYVRVKGWFGVIKEISNNTVTIALSIGEYRHFKIQEFIRQAEPIAPGFMHNALSNNSLYIDKNCKFTKLDTNVFYYIKINNLDILAYFVKFTESGAAMFKKKNGEAMIINSFEDILIVKLY